MRRKTGKTYRFEKKYLLDRDAAFVLKQRLSYIMQPDAFNTDGKYKVSTLYFDDQYNTSFFEKQNGLLIRDKFRARYYNDSLSMIRLERKHKYGEMVYKDSGILTSEQYFMMLRGDYAFMRERSEQVFSDFYASNALKLMRPDVMINYHRQAYTHPAGNVRITFDSDLTAMEPQADHCFSIMSDNNHIMEVKYDNFIPSYIEGLLTGFAFTQLALSKFYIAKQVMSGMHSIKSGAQLQSLSNRRSDTG